MTHNNMCISNVRPHEVVEPTTSMFVVDPFFWQPLKGAVCHSCIYGLYSHYIMVCITALSELQELKCVAVSVWHIGNLRFNNIC